MFRRLLVRTPIDVIHSHALLPDCFAAILVGREFHIPVVGTGHGSDVNVYPCSGRLTLWASKWAASRLGQFITVSHDLRRAALRLRGQRQTSVIQNGADKTRFGLGEKAEARKSLGLPREKKIVTFVGYLREEKSLDSLLDAFAILGEPGCFLCLVGDGPLMFGLKRQAARLGILGDCRFAGRVSHEEVPSWLAASDCLVLCSLSEGLPTILPEAMLARVPVIATPVGGIPEIIRDGETGTIVPCKDAPALAAAIRRVLLEKDRTAGMVSRAAALAESSLTWTANARSTLHVYEQAVKGSAGVLPHPVREAAA
jgi:glycosyltransferase involved in cell wall biosynthesis